MASSSGGPSGSVDPQAAEEDDSSRDLVIRSIVLAAATAVSLLAVSGAGGAAPQTPSRGGTVVVALPSSREPACLNWVFSACGPDPPELTPVFEGALEPGPHGYRSVLISRATFTKTPPFTVTFRIRPKARWSDGRPVTASDFVFSYRVLRKYGGPFGVDALGLMRSVSALDPRTVRVIYRTKTSFWRSESASGLPRALPRHALLGENIRAIWQDEIDNPKTGAPIGDGPFLLRRWDRGRQLILVRNPRYGGPDPPSSKGLCFGSSPIPLRRFGMATPT